MSPFPPEVVTAAKAGDTVYGVPASITLAQWALESGWGKHTPPYSNNPFGIKARPGDRYVVSPTREVVKGLPMTVQATFRVFPSLASAFVAHAELLATAACYRPAMKALPDLAGFARALQGVYATDPDYAAILMDIIDAHDLAQFDTPGSKPCPPAKPI